MRKPDFIVGSDADPYLLRWWVIPRNKWFNIYLHNFKHSDDDRALHDHMYWNVSVLLRGRYTEHMQDGRTVVRKAGAIILRRPEAAHRIELTDGEVWTLFITGPRVREWGFLCPQGWRHWKDFCGAPGKAGTGCE